MQTGVIAVMGATGNTGKKIAEALLKADEKVRALGRSESKLSALKRAGAEVLPGDANDAAFLTKAFRGADAVYTLLPTDQRIRCHKIGAFLCWLFFRFGGQIVGDGGSNQVFQSRRIQVGTLAEVNSSGGLGFKASVEEVLRVFQRGSLEKLTLTWSLKAPAAQISPFRVHTAAFHFHSSVSSGSAS